MRQGRNQASRDWFQEKSGLSLTPRVALEQEQYLREQYLPLSHEKSVASQTRPPGRLPLAESHSRGQVQPELLAVSTHSSWEVGALFW